MNLRTLFGSFLLGFRPLPIVATIGLFLFATVCQAGTVTATLNPVSSGDSASGIAFSLNGGSPGTYAGPFFWSSASSTGSPQLASAFSTFCIQIGTSVAPTHQYTFTTTSLAASTSISPIDSNDKVMAIEKLWGGFYDKISTYKYDGITVNQAINVSAFQLAIWRLEYDYVLPISATDLANFGAGHFQAGGTGDGLSAVNLAEQLVLQATGLATNPATPNFTTANTNLVTLTGGHPTGHPTISGQDQLTVATPEPSSMCLCAIGVATFIAARYRRRKGIV